MKKTLRLFTNLIMALVLVGCSSKTNNSSSETDSTLESSSSSIIEKSLDISVKEFNKYGNVILNVTFEELKENNIEVADIIKVTIGTDEYIIPVGSEYSDVDSGNMICRYDMENPKVILAVNGGNFAEATKMATKEKIEEDPGYKWTVSIDKVTLTLKEKNGYKDEYAIRKLERTNERSDYSNLSDADYANCRAINLTGMKQNVLFRGTTPLDDDMNRNTYAMEFLSNNNIKSIINLVYSNEEMKEYSTYADSYYSSCDISNIVMDYDFDSENFKSKVKECIIFINNNDGPYYIHCKEGKDRTGMLCAIIECYLGATYDEVVNDYMATYINFYKVEKNSETYNIILSKNLEKVLCSLFDVSTLKTSDLKKCAENYLSSCGLKEEDFTDLNSKLKA